MKNQHYLIVAILFIFLHGCFTPQAFAQPEFTTWGNMTDIRVDDQLMTFETSMSVVTPDWSKIWRTAKERQQTRFTREGNKKIFSYRPPIILPCQEGVCLAMKKTLCILPSASGT